MINKIIRKMSESDIKEGLKIVLQKLNEACNRRTESLPKTIPTLVAVSKTKPPELIIAAYQSGQRHFGENYVKELDEKGHNANILQQCKDIKWHFIGHLQRNKINKVLNVPGIYMIETIDSAKLADSVNLAWANINKQKDKLKVFVQVNTSGEEEKNGVLPSEVSNLYSHIVEKCPNLSAEGLMTIGKYGYDVSQGPNPDFICLKQCQETVCKDFKLDIERVQLSMGMSDDFEHAIEMGSTNVRVGTSIFGYRPQKHGVQETRQ